MLPKVLVNVILKCYVLVTWNCSFCKVRLDVCLKPASGHQVNEELPKRDLKKLG